MQQIITIMDDVLIEPSSVGTTKTIFDYPDGTITQINPPSENASDYTIILNGVEYVCDYFLNGDTKIKCAYRTSGHDTIYIEYHKNDGSVQVGIRHDEITFNVGETIKLICKVETPDAPKIKTSLVRFNRNKAVYLTYDEDSDVVTMEVL